MLDASEEVDIYTYRKKTKYIVEYLLKARTMEPEKTIAR
jgi:hypothetical protein